MSKETANAKEAMRKLMDQYDKIWRKATREEERYGMVTEKTEAIMFMIELEMEMLQNAM